MPRHPVFRVFVSSTFRDFQRERAALHERTFHNLRTFCDERRVLFEVVDLRWGVSPEAALDQRTMDICLDELRRSQALSPRPNFVVLLGNRYGWRPLPHSIPALSFRQILSALTPEERSFLDWDFAVTPGVERPLNGRGWYRYDGNARPATDKNAIVDWGEYLLQPRDQVMADAADDSAWTRYQAELLAALNKGREHAQLAVDEHSTIWQLTDSATHQEIRLGALQIADAPDHVCCCFRQMEPPDPAELDRAGDFFDVRDVGSKYACLDENAGRSVEALKQLLIDKLGRPAVHEYQAAWQGLVRTTTPDSEWEGPEWAADLPSETRPTTVAMIHQMCDFVEARLKGVMTAELQAIAGVDCSDEAQRAFLLERSLHVLGRDAVLQRISAFFDPAITPPAQSPGEHLMAVTGTSGAGKSAVLARTIVNLLPEGTISTDPAHGARLLTGSAHRTRHEQRLIFRFLGIDPRSSDLRALLQSLIRELAPPSAAPAAHDSEDIQDLAHRFHQQLKDSTEPIVLVLDALDQLNPSERVESLSWLPRPVPANVRILVSTLSESAASGELARDPIAIIYRHVQQRLARTSGLIVLENERLSDTTALEMLATWLAECQTWRGAAPRRLEQRQQEFILHHFHAEPTPLFLRLAFEESRKWATFDPLPGERQECSAGSTASTNPSWVRIKGKRRIDGVPGLLNALFDRLEHPGNHHPYRVRFALSYLACARYGLTEQEILEVLSAAPELTVRDGQVRLRACRHAEFQSHPDENADNVMWEFWNTECTEREKLAGYATTPVAEIPRDRRLLARLPPFLWTRLFSDLAPYISRRGADGVTVLSFYHRRFAETVRTRYLGGPAAVLRPEGLTGLLNLPNDQREEILAGLFFRCRIHEKLAAYFESQQFVDTEFLEELRTIPELSDEQRLRWATVEFFRMTIAQQRERMHHPEKKARDANLRKLSELPWQRIRLVESWRCLASLLESEERRRVANA